VKVQIGPFGHFLKKRIEGERPLLADMVEGSSGAGFAAWPGGCSMRDDRRHRGDEQGANDPAD
jgi:hypothetical protein